MNTYIFRLILILLLGMFAHSAAIAQSDSIQVDVSAEDLLTGEADERLQQAGAQAAIEQRPITLTAPSYWRELVEEQLQQGAGEDAELSITYRETFIESIIVRLGGVAETPAAVAEEEAIAAAAVEAPPPVVDIEPERPEVIEFERPTLESIEAPTQEAPEVVAEAINGNDLQPALELAIEEAPQMPDLAPVPAEETAPVEEIAAEEPPVTAAPEPAEPQEIAAVIDAPPETAPTVAEAAAANDAAVVAAARASLEERLNRGREIENMLRPDQLRPGDQLFRTDGVVAVVRRSSLRNSAYWLDGELDLERDEIRLIQPGKYEVRRLLDLEGEVVAEPAPAEPAEPVDPVRSVANDNLEERTRLEALYNGGKPIEQSVSSNRLLKDDMLYVGDGLVVVVRRTRVRLERYWLDGEIDLGRDELIQQGNRKYRVKRDIR